MGPCQPGIACLLQNSLFRPSHAVHGVMQMLGDVELVEDDLGVGVIERGTRRLDVRLPHVHRDRLNPVPLCGRQRRPEPIKALLLAVLGQIEHVTALQIRDHRQVAVPLGNALKKRGLTLLIFLNPRRSSPRRSQLRRSTIRPAAFFALTRRSRRRARQELIEGIVGDAQARGMWFGDGHGRGLPTNL